jgi:hypothetical protein
LPGDVVPVPVADEDVLTPAQTSHQREKRKAMDAGAVSKYGRS